MNYKTSFKGLDGTDGEITLSANDGKVHVVLCDRPVTTFVNLDVDLETVRRIARELNHFCNCEEMLEEKGAKE